MEKKKLNYKEEQKKLKTRERVKTGIYIGLLCLALGGFTLLTVCGAKSCHRKQHQEDNNLRVVGDYSLRSEKSINNIVGGPIDMSNRIDTWDYDTSTYGQSTYNQRADIIHFINPVEDEGHMNYPGIEWVPADKGDYWKASYLFADYCWRADDTDDLPFTSIAHFGDNFLRVQYNALNSNGLAQPRGGLAPMWYVKIVFEQSDYFGGEYPNETHNILTISEIILYQNKIRFTNQNERYHFELPYAAFQSGYTLQGNSTDFPFFLHRYNIYTIKEFHICSYRWYNYNIQAPIDGYTFTGFRLDDPLMLTYAVDTGAPTAPTVCSFFENNFYKTKYYLPRTFDYYVNANQEYIDERKLPYYTTDPTITKVYELGEVVDTSGSGNGAGVVVDGDSGLIGAFALIGMAFTAIGGFLSFQIAPGITLGTLFVLPLIVSIILVIVWIFKR